MDRVLLTGTFSTANTERPIVHGLGGLPDFAIVDTYTSTTDWLCHLSTTTAGLGYTVATVYVAGNQIASRFGVLAARWRGRAY